VFHEEWDISGDIQFMQLVTASVGSDERKNDLKWETIVSPIAKCNMREPRDYVPIKHTVDW
jgi:hypothetical protein